MNWQKLWSEQSLLSTALVPASWAYALALAAKLAPEPIKVEGLQVISVGNLLAGGAGKTPVVLFLAAWALERGHQAAVLSRGYGRRSSLAIHHAPNQPLPSVDEIGDEPRLLARRLPKLHLFVSANRVQSAQRARQAGCTIAILDDGFQHRRLYRDHDLLIDAGIGNGHLLPAGPLREPIAAAQRATIVWSRDGATALTSFNALRIEATHGVSSVLTPQGERPLSAIADQRVVALAGIARPAAFFDTLRKAGAKVLETHAFPDHHRFASSDIDRVVSAARRQSAVLVTTEKDAERLPQSLPLWLPRIGIDITHGRAELASRLGW